MSICDVENMGKAMINPCDVLKKSDIRFDALIINFSYVITNALIEDGLVEMIDDTSIVSIACKYPIYRFNDTNIGFVNTTVGAPITAGMIEEIGYVFDCKKFILFGSCGGLDKEITAGKIIVPTHAFRDEGMSYHYALPSDYIEIKNAKIVASVLKDLNIDYVEGGTWTTDAFYRETKEKYDKVKKGGCIAVEMEVAACQAVADYRGVDLYAMLYRGDNLDSEKWERGILTSIAQDERLKHFFIALEIAKRVIL